MATTALILHRVDDYDAWRTTYDSVNELRERGGVIDAQVLRPSNGDNVVAVTHDFESPEAARAFLANEELKGAMQRGGVDLDSFEVHLLERD
ncbi:MAG TPA: antibiotic biosynthesis monooxygenase [Solirubrobacterales bacterium]